MYTFFTGAGSVKQIDNNLTFFTILDVLYLFSFYSKLKSDHFFMVILNFGFNIGKAVRSYFPLITENLIGYH